MKQESQHQTKRQLILLGSFAVFMLVFFALYPQKAVPTLTSAWNSLTQFLVILPVLIFLLGYCTVMIDPEKVKKTFGKGAGMKGAVKAMLFGSLMSTGPFYMAFPIAKSLKDKGANITDLVVFLSSWNGLTMIAAVVEVHFMGPAFMLVRTSLTIACTFIISFIAGIIYPQWGKRGS